MAIYSILNNKLLKPFKSKNGYLNITLYIDKFPVRKGVHQIIAETFIPNPENKPEVNHKDGNKENNWDWNLEWVTQKENNIHAIQNKLRIPPSGEKFILQNIQKFKLKKHVIIWKKINYL